MEKKAVIEALVGLEQKALLVAKEHYEEYVAGAHVTRSQASGSDDQSQAYFAGELAEAFEHPQEEHAAKVAALENIDFSPKEVVGVGAIVKFSGRHFVISVSTTRFKCGGVEYMGISTEAPIYKAIAGKKSGDIFSYNGRDITIEGVW